MPIRRSHPTRRTFLKTSLATSALAGGLGRVRSRAAGERVVVVGAGAFGGWSALALQRAGARVTVIDAWGPGNARASSGGDTRVIRGIYGPQPVYVRMAARALAAWRDFVAAVERPHLYRRTGALWMFPGSDAYARGSFDALREVGLAASVLTPAEAARRFPQFSFEGISSVVFEPEAGYLMARQACQTVIEAFVEAGGRYEEASMRALTIRDGRAVAVDTTRGAIDADAFVIAAGPWLGRVLPDVIGARIAPSRQDVFYFGTPAADTRFADVACPVWVEFGERLMYGIPDNARRGFKVADDTRGAAFDPTSGARLADPAALDRARALLRRRVPALGDAPVVGSEVCQYENSPDGDFIIDRHPGAANVWIAGGGSGHGFKMGPAIGDLVAGLVQRTREPEPLFALSRFAHAVPGKEVP